MSAVDLVYKVFTFEPSTPNGRPTQYPVKDVVFIETSKNGMEEILTTKDGEIHTVKLHGLRTTITKDRRDQQEGQPEPSNRPEVEIVQ